MMEENDTNETDEDDIYRPFFVSKRTKRKKSRFRLKSEGDVYNSEDFDESEISDQELESFFRTKPKKIKRGGISKKPDHKKKITNKECELVFLLKWKQNTRLSSICHDERLMKMQETEKLSKSDLSKYGEDIQALLINLVGSPFTSNEQKLRWLQELDLGKRLMRNGIVWLWSEIAILQDLMKLMERKNFKYIEHFTLVHLSVQRALAFLDPNEKKAYQAMVKEENKGKETEKRSEESSEELDETQSSDVSAGSKHGSSYDWLVGRLMAKKTMKTNEIFADIEQEEGYLLKSKSVLLMFRRFDVKNSQLELRHQRTCDVLFDLLDENERSFGLVNAKTKEYIYKMIETLLPKANIDLKENPKKVHLKMMEMSSNLD